MWGRNFGVLTGICGMSNRPGLEPQDKQKVAQALQQQIRTCVLRRERNNPMRIHCLSHSSEYFYKTFLPNL